MKREWFEGRKAVGVTAGASAPELLVERVVARIREWGGDAPVNLSGQQESVVFSLPRELRVSVEGLGKNAVKGAEKAS
jgi:4-hydroxy-3-methylbut-2-enyl diphosphate reductase